eukprot:Opistho-1_new@65066
MTKSAATHTAMLTTTTGTTTAAIVSAFDEPPVVAAPTHPCTPFTASRVSVVPTGHLLTSTVREAESNRLCESSYSLLSGPKMTRHASGTELLLTRTPVNATLEPTRNVRERSPAISQPLFGAPRARRRASGRDGGTSASWPYASYTMREKEGRVSPGCTLTSSDAREIAVSMTITRRNDGGDATTAPVVPTTPPKANVDVLRPSTENTMGPFENGDASTRVFLTARTTARVSAYIKSPRPSVRPTRPDRHPLYKPPVTFTVADTTAMHPPFPSACEPYMRAFTRVASAPSPPTNTAPPSAAWGARASSPLTVACATSATYKTPPRASAVPFRTLTSSSVAVARPTHPNAPPCPLSALASVMLVRRKVATTCPSTHTAPPSSAVTFSKFESLTCKEHLPDTKRAPPAPRRAVERETRKFESVPCAPP